MSYLGSHTSRKHDRVLFKNQSVSDWVSEWVSEWFSQSVSQPASQPVSQSVSQSINQLTHHQINQPANQPAGHLPWFSHTPGNRRRRWGHRLRGWSCGSGSRCDSSPQSSAASQSACSPRCPGTGRPQTWQTSWAPGTPAAWGRSHTSEWLYAILQRINNNNRIQRRYSRFFTISSQRRELSPTRTLKWPRRNLLQITCNTSRAYHVQHVVLRATWYEGTAQLLSLTELKSHLFELYFVGWIIKLMKEGRKPEYPEKTPSDELQKMPHTTARRFKPQARLEPAQ